jgi:HAD superfamily hydrolase (TIGR01509 family)
MGDRAARAVARRITAVLFDWRGTLAHSPPPRWWGERGLESAGSALDTHDLDRVETALREAGALEGIDASADVHRRETLAAFRRHGLDGGLADALYALDADPVNHPLYPDAAPVLGKLKERGAGVAVVSDFHVELRPMLAAAGIADLCDACIVSAEHGVQKPDPRIFEIALDALDVDASEALMVGDRASRDGGAAGAGVATLILPPPPADLVPRGLDVVLRIVG